MKTLSPDHTAAVARIGRALSDETRAAILCALRDEPARPSELADALGVTRQAMSNHLTCLRGCGLVDAVRDGRNVWYRLPDPHLAATMEGLLALAEVVDPTCCSPRGCTCR